MDSLPILPIVQPEERLPSEEKLPFDRFNVLEKCFKERYNYLPHFYVRVPGRVNLIGEHIDYSGFSVLPMAIERDIILAVGTNKSGILNLINIDKKYEDYSESIEGLMIDKERPMWYHYFLCGLRGVNEEWPITVTGMDVAMKGTIPVSSGLSSSSAIVCAAAVAICYSNRLPMSKSELASVCAKSERYIGTEGGGMDQAIEFLAESGAAKFIEFEPLKTTDVFLPKDAVFVVANSCVPVNKAQTSHYNTRVVECKLAAKLLAKGFSLDLSTVRKLKDISDQIDIPLKLLPPEIKKHLHKEPYTRSEICELLEISENEFESSYLTHNTKQLDTFKLYQRAYHVFAEASRVLLFKELCETNPPDVLERLGRLMLESHVSCSDLYECSHPDLDEFVRVATGYGAFGARLTGAGWGGCCVALVKSEHLVSFLDKVKNRYYLKYPHRSRNWESCLFATRPGGGAAVHTT